MIINSQNQLEKLQDAKEKKIQNVWYLCPLVVSINYKLPTVNVKHRSQVWAAHTLLNLVGLLPLPLPVGAGDLGDDGRHAAALHTDT